MLRLGQILTCVALLSLSGGHWAFLQGVAWTGMLIKYSDSGLVGAVSMTFDGEHPCDLCNKIEQSKADQKEQSELEVTLADLKAIVARPHDALLRLPTGNASYLLGAENASARTTSPAAPPPRRV